MIVPRRRVGAKLLFSEALFALSQRQSVENGVNCWRQENQQYRGGKIYLDDAWFSEFMTREHLIEINSSAQDRSGYGSSPLTFNSNERKSMLPISAIVRPAFCWIIEQSR